MHTLSKALAASGLVILTGPLCFMAQAQGYVDVEAERAAATGSRPVPRSRQHPPATPMASTGAGLPSDQLWLNSAPAAPSAVLHSPVRCRRVRRGQNLGNLFYQMQQLQQEVMRLNGKVEEQAHELRTLKEQSLQRYVDLDKRLSDWRSVGDSTGAAGTAQPARPVLAATSGAASVPGTSQRAEQPGEGEAYRAAYALVRGQQFDQAVPAFQQFLRITPMASTRPMPITGWASCTWWCSRRTWSIAAVLRLLLSQYPDNSKAPDALYKLGKVQFMKGNRDKAREYLDRVIREYGSTNSSAVKLARDFIAENY